MSRSEGPPRRSSLPRWLQLELQRTSRTGKAEEAQRWVEQLFEARARDDLAGTYRAAVRAKQAAPRSPVVREALGLAAYQSGSWHEAAQELLAHRRFAGGHEHDPLIADCYRRLGRHERALEVVEAVPTSAAEPWVRAQVIRAEIIAERGEVATAVGLLRAARTRAPSRTRGVLDEVIRRLEAT